LEAFAFEGVRQNASHSKHTGTRTWDDEWPKEAFGIDTKKLEQRGN